MPLIKVQDVHGNIAHVSEKWLALWPNDFTALDDPGVEPAPAAEVAVTEPAVPKRVAGKPKPKGSTEGDK